MDLVPIWTLYCTLNYLPRFCQAVLSIQLAITLVVASVMSRVGPFFSFARWLLTRGAGLVRYIEGETLEET